MEILQLILYICIVATTEIFALESERIYKGRNCDSQEYPYLAPIAGGQHLICGGSFVAPGWVLTAAHCCVAMTKPWAFTVVGGQSRWMEDEREYTRVEAVYPHEQYKGGVTPLSSDICLVKLKNRVTPSERIKISKLATTADYERFIKNGKCNESLIMGFGNQLPDLENQTTFDTRLKCANLPVLPWSKCQGNATLFPLIANDVFCVKDFVEVHVGACLGDDGGPVYCENLQIGVGIGSAGCGSKYEMPNFYIRVDQFKDYIERQIEVEEGKSSAVRSKRFLKILIIFTVIINIVAILNINILNT